MRRSGNCEKADHARASASGPAGAASNEGLAYLLFMLMRWGSLTTQICPKCGAMRHPVLSMGPDLQETGRM
jgi:hypothetical protein